MFEPIVSPIPGLSQRFNIFSTYHVCDWCGLAFTKLLILAGDVDAQNIMYRCTYNTHLLLYGL